MPVFKAIIGDWEKITSGDCAPDWEKITYNDKIVYFPPARARLFREKFNALDQRREAACYYVLYGLDPSWKKLCVHLYRARETVFLQLS